MNPARDTRSSVPGVLIGVTILLSAFLLFEVQPLIARLILPWFGGAAAVWTACMLFFQSVLLGGYAYAHWLGRQTGKRQAWIHVTLLAVSLAALPILPAARWKPVGAGDPLVGILGLLAATVGLPYFLLATTGPLLQAWYSRAKGGAMPWRFFALSNAGSLLGLLSYPVVVEPLLTGRRQAWMWSGAYTAFALLCGTSAVLFRHFPAARTDSDAPLGDLEPPSIADRLIWLALACSPSAILLTVTAYLTQNLAPIPLLWVLPLSIYLISFILCFDSDRWYRRGAFAAPGALGIIWLVYLVTQNYTSNVRDITVPVATALTCAAIFAIFMVCHGELSKRRPAPAFLTSFYLSIAAGGALGGLLIGAAAPVLLPADWDFPASVALTALLLVYLIRRERPRMAAPARLLAHARDGWIVLLLTGLLLAYISARIVDPDRVTFPAPEDDSLALVFVAAIALLLLWRGRSARARTAAAVAGLVFAVGGAGLMARGAAKASAEARVQRRNFYGSIKETDVVEIGASARFLVHGNVRHGEQLLPPLDTRRPTLYYARGSGIALALEKLMQSGPVKAGVIGLGAGTLAAYCRQGDWYRFYELNPLVITIASNDFTFLSECPGRVEVLEGDARLTLEREGSQQYDILVVDAFSSDAIPVHLLTREAFQLYWKQLKPDGVLAINVSNRYVDLAPLVLTGAEERLKDVRLITERSRTSGSDWVLVSSRPEFLDRGELGTAGRIVDPLTRLKMWTDDFSSIYRFLR